MKSAGRKPRGGRPVCCNRILRCPHLLSTRAGERKFVTEAAPARAFLKGTFVTMQPPTPVPAVVAALCRQQRKRAMTQQSRVMLENRLQALVAGAAPLGYHAGMAEKDRTRVFKEAAAIIKAVAKGTMAHDLENLIVATKESSWIFRKEEQRLEAGMEAYLGQLPIAAWVAHPDQRGLGQLGCAILIGEAGDLTNYGPAISDCPDREKRVGYFTPSRLWKRLGCAPLEYGGETHMGATWRGKKGGLPAEVWVAFGYNPQRHSIAYQVGKRLMMQNGDGPYRRRYDEAKARAQENHPDWTPAHRDKHAILLATKRLLLNLWVEWNKVGDVVSVTENKGAD